MTERRVIVTGSREWPKQHVIWNALAEFKPTLVIHGGCVYGPDAMAERWCTRYEVDSFIIRAKWTSGTGDWRQNDRSAGPVRNRRMLDRFPGVPVLAFPYGIARGTKDCIKAAVERRHPLTIFDTDGRVRGIDWASPTEGTLARMDGGTNG